MSALCRNRRWRAMTDSTLKSTAPSITARPTLQEKRSFAEVAAKLRVSESTLALIAIRTLLASDVPDLPPRTSSSEPAVDRITIRLRPGDRLAIRHRAAERRMKDSAYIAALVRGHVAANPPLAAQELAALKAAVSVLAGCRPTHGTDGSGSRAGGCSAAGPAAGPEPYSRSCSGRGAASARIRPSGAGQLGEPR